MNNNIPIELSVRLQVMEIIAVPIIITKESSEIIWANKAWSQMTGYSLLEATGKFPNELVKSGKMKNEIYEQLWQTITSGKTWKGRIVNRRKNGHFYTEEMSITPFISESDGKTYFVATKEDVSMEERLLLSISKDKQNTIFDISSNIMVELNTQGEIEDINQRGANLLGYDAYEIRGKNWFDLATTKNETEEIRSYFKSLVSGNLSKNNNYTNKVKTKTGEIKYINWQTQLLYDETGNIWRVVSSGWEITDLVKKSNTIKRQNKLFNIESKIGKIISQNKNATKIIEEIVEEIYKNNLVKNVWIAIHNETDDSIMFKQNGIDEDQFDENINKLFKQSENLAFNCKNITKEFAIFDKDISVLCKNCPLANYEEEGHVAAWGFKLSENKDCYISILFSSEIIFEDSEKEIIRSIFNLIKTIIEKSLADEQRTEAEARLKTSEGKQQIIFHNNLSANYITTPEGKILDCNKAFLEMFEFKNLNEALNYDPNKFYPSDIKRNYFIDLINKKKIIENWERTYYTNSGRAIDVLENTVGHFDENGKLSEIHGFVVDISELKIKEKRLKEALEKAKESERLKAAFLSNISHEIRTPMNHIMGFAHVLRDSDLDKETREYLLKTIENSGEKLVNMIGEIIDLSKLDAGQLKLNPNFFDISELILNIIRDFQKELVDDKQNIRITCKKDLSIPKEIYSDESRIRQIFESLISNAIKFSNQGEIEIDFKLKQDALWCSVKDQGIGVKKYDQKNIFKRFVKGSNPDLQNIGGTGLGLSLVDELVKLMGGEIKIESEYGKGSIFSFSLSKVKTREQINKEKKKLKNKGIMQNLKILIAEDDDSNFQLLKILLKPLQPEVIRAWNGLEAIEMVKQNQDISLILMDLKMPEMDGFIATKEIKLIHPNLPIIAQTAYALVGDKEKAIEAGCDFYISKPIDHRKLKEVIEKAIMMNEL